MLKRRIENKASMSKDKETLKEVNLLNKIKELLLKNEPVRKIELTDEELKIIKPFNLLTLKPIIYMANVSENDLKSDGNIYVDKIREFAKGEKAKVIVVCAQIESELSELNEDDKLMLLNELGVKESGLDKLITATYSLLGLKTYFTAGSDEVRAWTFKDGMKAPECAGIIHTDFEKGFIKAEVMSYDDLVQCGNEKNVKEKGKMRLEGKEYLMQDGDICYFRFNV